jgi:hypothetical protein
MLLMIRTSLALWVGVCVAVVGLSVAALAEPNVSGAWRVDFVTPLGQTFVNMYISQSGTRLSGHATDEFGEYSIEGRVTDDQVTVVWEVPEDGKMLEITMKGKLEGNVITGTAKLGDVGEGPLTARRTGDGDDQR